jgi:hypothetical protein
MTNGLPPYFLLESQLRRVTNATGSGGMTEPVKSDVKGAVEREADRIEEDCLFSAKGHFESARLWGRWNLILGISATVLGAAAGVSAFKSNPELAGYLAFASAAVTGLLTFLKPSDRAAAHHAAGTQFTSLKNRARVFREVELRTQDRPAALTKLLKRLSESRNSLNESSPQVLRAAFERARRGIEAGEAAYRADGAEGRS